MRYGIRKQVCHELSDLRGVPFGGSRKLQIEFDAASRSEFDFGDDGLDDLMHRDRLLGLKLHLAAETACREIHQVVDERGHAQQHALHVLHEWFGLDAVAALQKAKPGRKGGDGVAKVVAHHCDEFLPQSCDLAFASEIRLASGQATGGLEGGADQVGAKLE
nr:hypothetical protein [uncultured Jannaschia sp.]